MIGSKSRRFKPSLAVAIALALVGFTVMAWPRSSRARSDTVPAAPHLLDAGELIAPMVVVLGLLGALALSLPHLARSSWGMKRRGRHLQIVEAVPLGGKRCLYLVRVHDRALVIGADDGKLATLSEIADAAFVEQLDSFGGELKQAERGMR